jgi:glycosyltransferase involved in cell wall biosynthesis
MERHISLGSKMRVVLLSPVYPPEPVTSASTSHSLACELAKRGHEVTVITSYPNRPGGRVYPGFRRRLFAHHETKDGIEIVRCFSTTSRNSTLLSRLAENLSFGFSAGFETARMRRPDVIYTNTWAIFAAGIASWVAGVRRIPVVLSIHDVYPESLISLKKLNPGTPIFRLLRWLDTCTARAAAAVVVISESFEEIYSRDREIPYQRIHRIADWRAIEDTPQQEIAQRQRSLWGIGKDAFLIVFAGNVAAACGIESVIGTVSGLGEDSLVRLVIAGSGSALEGCRSIARQHKSGSVEFSGPFLANETLAILSAGDILILPTQGDQSLVCMPSKLISYMMSGRPVLAVARLDSDLARVVNEAGCGWVVEPGESEELVRQLGIIVAMERSKLTRMGLLGRQYALTHFSTEACLPKLVAVIENAARG